jgi:hypothetical protein
MTAKEKQKMDSQERTEYLEAIARRDMFIRENTKQLETQNQELADLELRLETQRTSIRESNRRLEAYEAQTKSLIVETVDTAKAHDYTKEVLGKVQTILAQEQLEHKRAVDDLNKLFASLELFVSQAWFDDENITPEDLRNWILAQRRDLSL